MNAIELAAAGLPLEIRGGWMRLPVAQLDKMTETRAALHQLRATNARICVLLRWPGAENWRKLYLPEDLRATYENASKHGAAFGDLVDAWEIDNEPDLGFVPELTERYTAFLKATYLGLQHGIADGQQRVAGNEQRADRPLNHAPISKTPRTPLVIMGSLGLPPGPWLERFAANDGFAYTDGYNYHYYGYAEDFTGVYRQHEAAVKELSKPSTLNTERSTAPTKSLPIFLTEIGYGMLGKQARDTKEGRLRQWRWFKSVGEQSTKLGIEAPMAFYLPPFFDRPSESEFGLTVAQSAVASAMTQRPNAKPHKFGRSVETRPASLPQQRWIAGGIEYSTGDFGDNKPRQWMALIGEHLSGNQVTPALAHWLAATRGAAAEIGRSTGLRHGSRTWPVTTLAPSPVVIDFLAGDGLSSIKRYHGNFVTAKSLTAETSPPPIDAGPPSSVPPPPATARREECIIQIRTKNGNLYEVYPTRLATHEWQHYLEPHDNFTMSFYGRAELPWRFKENQPASFVVVMYPKQLPATFEFRHPMLARLGEGKRARNGKQETSPVALANMRYGRGKVILYNFSVNPITGRLQLPECVAAAAPNAEPLASAEPSSVLRSPPSVVRDFPLTLAPGERREVPVRIQVAAEFFTRIEAPISFVPDDIAIPTARFLTTFIPDIGGMKATVIGRVLDHLTTDYAENTDLIRSRPRASEEAPMLEQDGRDQTTGSRLQISAGRPPSSASGFTAFAQSGAAVERTATGFGVTVTSIPPGKPQRVEVEIPWPEGLDFPADAFLSVEFRLR